MTDSLRDQLLGLGFKPKAPEKKPGQPPKRKPNGKRSPLKVSKPDGEFDLARAYAARNAQEQRERAEAERLAQEQARLKREARAKLAELLQGKALNDEAADIARHFEYGGKIKRIYVTADQLKALNAGELGVLQQNGRYLLVSAVTLAEAAAIFPPAVALQVDPSAPTEDDPYADPQYQVPDDLVW